MGYCSRGLLGFQSDASKVFERLYSKVNQDGQQAVETLRELWAHAFENMRQGIVDELRFFSRAEAGETNRGAELRKAESVHGPGSTG